MSDSPRRVAQGFSNVYEDERRAEAYAKLEFPATYYLAYRDLPAILDAHVHGRHAMDFGCGTAAGTPWISGAGRGALRGSFESWASR
jgi:hypothetical protein